MKEDKPYIFHILDAIESIEEGCKGLDRAGFEKNELVRDATLRRIEIIGEAAKHLSPPFREAHKEVPWSKITGMRDKLIHYYMGVDYKVVWEVVSRDLPALRKTLLRYDERHGNKPRA